MWFVGIDVAAETHSVAAVEASSAIVLRPTPITEDAPGYEQLRALLGAPAETLIALEATGHYWQNLVGFLLAEGFAVALLNPLRTRRFAEEELSRAKTDALDALAIARFAAQKRPPATRLADPATQERRELMRLRDRLEQDLGDRVRQLHRLVDLGFPEFTAHVHRLDSALATTLLHAYPTAAAFRGGAVRALAHLRYDGRHPVGHTLADALVTAAATSVGRHDAPVYQLEVRYFCEDITRLRERLRAIDRDVHRTLQTHEVGTLLTTIPGIGVQTAARLVGELGDPAKFRDAAALAAYVGVVPGVRQSGKRRPERHALSPLGNGRLRAKLWMPTRAAVRYNPWLRAFYDGLRLRGKLPKVALIAAMRQLLAAIYSVAKHRRPFVARPAAEVPA